MSVPLGIRALTIFVGFVFSGSPVYALDLLRAYESALGNDPTFRAAVKENEAGEANRVIGRAAVLPKIGLNYNQFANDSLVSGPIVTNGPSQNVHKAYPSDLFNVQVTQPLFNLAALAQMRQGNAQGDMSNAKFIYQTQDLLVRVLQAYTDVLYAEDSLRYALSQRDAYREQLKVNQRSFERGAGTITDALETRASYEISEAQVIESANQAEVAKRKLEALIGENLTSTKEVRGLSNRFKVEPLVPKAFEIWKDNALASNAELRASEHNVEVARQEYQKQRAAHYPTVAAVAGWSQQKSQNYSAINQNALNSQVGVQISVPLFSGGEIEGRSSQARANYEKAQAERDQTRDKIITELRKQYDVVSSSIQKIGSLNRAVESSYELTKAMRKSVKGGEKIKLDVLLAERALTSSEKDMAQAKYNYMLSVLRLKMQAGSLTLEDLEKISKNFQTDQIKK